MATVVPPKKAWDRTETSRRVRHPLQRLRSTIRTYVTLEGLSVFLLYVLAWFWIGLLLDYGVFKLFGYDWVQQMPRTVGADSFRVFRVSVLVILLAGLLAVVATKVLLRLLREFRDSALALVLERRFPERLGDRLITAVEMADPQLSVKYGHSQDMVDQTIRDAADRVDAVPVREVFNWRRLWLYGLTVLGLTAGLFALLGTAYCVFAEETVGRYLYHARDVAGIWAERNLLLQNSLWPRDAHLEVIRFPGSKNDPDELRIGDHNPSTDLWVRAAQWVVADDRSVDGWRPLRWRDLKTVLGEQPEVALPDEWDGWVLDVDDLDAGVPTNLIPETWRGKTVGFVKRDLRRGAETPYFLGIPLPRVPGARDRLRQAGMLEPVRRRLFTWQDWTVDRIMAQVKDNGEVRRNFRENYHPAYQEFERVLQQLQELVDSGAVDRRLRKLDVPDQVTLVSYSDTNTNRKTFSAREDNKYQVNVTLTESVRFVVQAEDYATPEKKITLVPRPRLKTLVANRWEPAYIYYRMQGPAGDLVSQLPLKGKRQVLRDQEVGVSDQAATIELPAGSDIELVGETTDALKDKIRLEPFKKTEEGGEGESAGGLPEGGRLEFLTEGGKPSRTKFRLKFNAVGQPIDFVLKFVNEDNVEGECRITIEPKIDTRPEVSVQMVKNVFRQKANTDYSMVTPLAAVPFEGKVADDHGLNRVVWAYRITAVKKEATVAKIETVLTAHQFLPNHVSPVMGPAYLAWLTRQMAQAERKKEAEHTVAMKDVRDETQLQNLLASGATVEGTHPVQRYLEEAGLHRADEVTPDKLAGLLADKPPVRGLLKLIRLKTEDDFFSFKDYLRGLKSPGDSALQLRCVVELWVTAADNNVEVDDPVNNPATGESKQRFSFLVVGENELLAEIFREEEDLRIELEKVFKKLQEARTKQETQVLAGLADALTKADLASLKATRSDEVKKTIGLNSRDIAVLHSAFTRILQELEANEVQKTSIHRVRDLILEPLRQMMDKNTGEFKLAEGAAERLQLLLEEAQKELEAGGKPGPPKAEELQKAGADSRRRLDELISRLGKVLDAMQKIIDKDALIRIAVEIEEKQRQQTDKLNAHEQYLKKILLKDLTE